jgi:polar amino acid transport system substrate-binding protein
MKANLSGLILASALAATPATAGALEDALGRGTLRVCTAEAPPFVFRASGGEHIGHEIDIVSRLASDAGLVLELKVGPMSDVLDRLNAGECDLAAAALAIAPDKLLKAWMTNPYAESEIRIVVSSKAPIPSGQLNVPETAIGIVTGTLAADLARLAAGRIESRRSADRTATRIASPRCCASATSRRLTEASERRAAQCPRMRSQ